MTRPDRPAQFALFDAVEGVPGQGVNLALEPGAVVLRAFAANEAPALLAAIEVVAQAAPWRHMTTVRGWRMSVAMTNCGEAGWLSDRSGYRCERQLLHTVFAGQRDRNRGLLKLQELRK